jgi:PAS domain S-box-containing protein
MHAVADASRWRLLLVEHEAAYAAMVARAFDSHRFRLTVADRLQQALELLRHQSHDLVLLDLRLPDSLGSDTVARVTASAPGVPLIILTDDNEVLDVRARGHDYIVKGEFNARRLIRTAVRAIRRSAMARARHEKNEQFRVMVSEMPICVWSTDRDLRLTTSAGAALRRFNVRTDELVGQSLPDYVGNESTIVTHARRALAGESVRCECEWDSRTLGIYQEPLRDSNGVIIGTVGLSTDTTESKRANARLLEYEKAIEGVEEMIIVIDRNYRYLIANQAFLNYRQLRREQAVGHSVDEFLDRTTWENIVKNKVDECFTGKTVTYEIKSSSPQRGERDVTVSLFPIYGSHRVDRVAAVMHDVTERKASETRLHDALAQLRAVSTRLNVVREQERARIAREIHDELGQALTALKMDVAEVRRRLKAADVSGADARLTEMSTRIDAASDDVRRVITELRPVILDEMGIVAAIKSHLDNVQRRGLTECVLTVDRHDLDIADDVATAVFRIMQEAVTNVLRHAGARQVQVTLTADTASVRLSVQDDGCGMPPIAAQNPRALGIVGMRDRALLFGGDVSIASSPGQGTTVTARLPLVPAP